MLTLFAVEEHENHLSLSPGKGVIQLLEVSHSRLSSRAVQYLLHHGRVELKGKILPCGEARTNTEVRNLRLPTNNVDEAFKYVREAVRGHPELYFARLVILGEGPSEEIVLRKLFEASGTPLDAYFISVVPLGGRHVNHFWRLLNGLGIPYITFA